MKSGEELTYALRKPMVKDAESIWSLVKKTGVLDVNSTYAYMLLCRDFAETSVVVEQEQEIVGMVTGYVPPGRPQNLFIWQIAVDASMRGYGLAGKMLHAILERDHLTGIEFIETTVTLSNQASRRVFAKLARHLETELSEEEGFPEDLFPDDHESEALIKIGPIQTSTLSN